MSNTTTTLSGDTSIIPESPILPENSNTSFKGLSPLFGPNDFYYYNAQFPGGIQFLGSVIGLDINDPEYLQYTDPSYSDMNTSINGSTYSIPYELLKIKCSDRTTLLNDISNALYTYLQNGKENRDTTEEKSLISDNKKIKYGSPNSITISDTNGVKYTYYSNSEDSSNSIEYNQNSEDNSFYGDVNMNVANTFYKSLYKYVEDPSNSYYNGNLYYQTLNMDVCGNQCISRTLEDFSNCCVLQSSKYESCSNSQLIKNTNNSIDSFVENLGSMSFDVFPDYSSVNVYDVGKSDSTEKANDSIIMVDISNTTILINKIADYYTALCENKETAEKYQNLVNKVMYSGSNQLYQTTVDMYYREYQRILNISVGILITMGVLYTLSK